MAEYVCKMCGGQITDVPEDAMYKTCPYCGNIQTFLRISNERKQKLYLKAEEYRQNGDYDKAEDVCIDILKEDPNDAESYWMQLLCVYGILYVESDGRRIPTINRLQYKPVVSSDYYKMACSRANAGQRSIYEKEAANFDSIQKKVLEIASKEEPYDVFISYKSKNPDGSRTEDSVIAGELYNQLSREGYKVFYADVTLEKKLGREYEPYIFAALNSAKIMLAVATSRQNIDSVWVRNEWKRYFAIMKEHDDRVIMPCIKNMDAYDLPQEFAHVQIMNLKNIGCVSDILRVVRKQCEVKNQSSDDEIMGLFDNGTYDAFMFRGKLYLEDKNWSEARKMFERAHSHKATEQEVYIGILCARFKTDSIEGLKTVIANLIQEATEKESLSYFTGMKNAVLNDDTMKKLKKVAKGEGRSFINFIEEKIDISMKILEENAAGRV